MLRIKDPKKTIPFYENNFGLKLLHRYDFEQWKFSLYFMGILKDGVTWPEVNTTESAKALWTMEFASTLELTHNWGSEDDDTYQTNNGNDSSCFKLTIIFVLPFHLTLFYLWNFLLYKWLFVC